MPEHFGDCGFGLLLHCCLFYHCPGPSAHGMSNFLAGCLCNLLAGGQLRLDACVAEINRRFEGACIFLLIQLAHVCAPIRERTPVQGKRSLLSLALWTEPMQQLFQDCEPRSEPTIHTLELTKLLVTGIAVVCASQGKAQGKDATALLCFVLMTVCCVISSSSSNATHVQDPWSICWPICAGSTHCNTLGTFS